MKQISIPPFFRDFQGSVDDFKLYIDGLPDIEKDKFNRGITFIHPEDDTLNLSQEHLGTYIYANKRFYKMCDCIEQSPNWPFRINSNINITGEGYYNVGTSVEVVGKVQLYKEGIIPDTIDPEGVQFIYTVSKSTNNENPIILKDNISLETEGSIPTILFTDIDTHTEVSKTTYNVEVKFSYADSKGVLKEESLNKSINIYYCLMKYAGLVHNNFGIGDVKNNINDIFNDLIPITTDINTPNTTIKLSPNSSITVQKGKVLYMYPIPMVYGGDDVLLKKIWEGGYTADTDHPLKYSTDTLMLNGKLYRFYLMNNKTGNGTEIEFRFES